MAIALVSTDTYFVLTFCSIVNLFEEMCTSNSVEITEIYTFVTFLEKFRESNCFANEITKKLSWRNFFGESFFHFSTLCILNFFFRQSNKPLKNLDGYHACIDSWPISRNIFIFSFHAISFRLSIWRKFRKSEFHRNHKLHYEVDFILITITSQNSRIYVRNLDHRFKSSMILTK